MLSQFDKVDYIKTDSVLEALVLEAHLIKKYQPEANIKEKDNRSFNFVVITKENFPRVLIIRSRELDFQFYRGLTSVKTSANSTNRGVAYSFGPFPNGTQLKEAMKIVRKMFPYRDKCEPCLPRLSASSPRLSATCRPCFSRQVGLCPGVCTGEITKEEYAKQIKNIILFFEGNKKRLMKNLEKQMRGFAKEKKFEQANIIKHTLFTLNHIQDISLIKEDVSKSLSDTGFRIESYDVAHLSGTNVVGVMTVVEDGEVKKSDYRKFKIQGASNPDARLINDTRALSEILSRRLAHIEWRTPDLIVVDGGLAQKRAMEKVLQKNNHRIPVVSVVKDEHHRPKQILGDLPKLFRNFKQTGKKYQELEREILLSNSEAHRYAINFHKQLRSRIPRH